MSKLILVRHGQSEWNPANRFTGWWDVDLTEKGETEAREAGELMRAKNVLPTVSFTSVQKRAIKTQSRARGLRSAVDPGHARLAPQRAPLRRLDRTQQAGNPREAR